MIGNFCHLKFEEQIPLQFYMIKSELYNKRINWGRGRAFGY